MSSEESDDFHDLKAVYRVKILPWRRNISSELAIIDQERRAEMAGFSTKGSIPIVHIRDDVNPVSIRKPVTQLPRVFYDDKWFDQSRPSIREKSLSVSKEQFEWLALTVGTLELEDSLYD